MNNRKKEKEIAFSNIVPADNKVLKRSIPVPCEQKHPPDASIGQMIQTSQCDGCQ
jgi:hypothetical protein